MISVFLKEVETMERLKAIDRLKYKTLQKALESYIVPIVLNNYEVAAVRVLFKENEEIWTKRIKLEELLRNEEKIVGFFLVFNSNGLI